MNKQALALEKIALCKEERQLYLDLSHLELTEIPQELSTLVWLEHLSLSHNKIEDIDALEPLKKIHKLSLSNDQISDLSPLASNESVKFLFIQNNRICDLTSLSHLYTLKKLVAHDNEIEEIGSLLSLPQLVYVDLENNKCNLRPLEDLDTLLILKA